MISSEGIPALGEDEAREILNRWASGGFFRLRNLGDKIFVDQITPGAAYTIRLQTHYEERKVSRASVPYQGGAVDDRGRPPNPWEVAVKPPRSFEERTEIVPVPHTGRVEMCPDCAGEGRVGCPRCMGQGRMPCPWCGGRGVVFQTVMETGHDSQGNLTPQPRTISRPCSCSGGQVVCSECGGNRFLRCRGCAGSGQVKTYEQLVVRFQNAAQGEVVDVTPVPDAWLGNLSGEVLVDQKANRIEEPEPLPEPAALKTRDLLQKSHDVDERHTRIIRQALHVERLPLYEIRYKYAGVERHLWICGTEKDVYAPNAPLNRQRVMMVTGGAVLAAAVLLGLAAVLLWW